MAVSRTSKDWSEQQPASSGALASQSESATFEPEARRTLERLRAALAMLIESVPGSASRPTDLERSLNIGTKLAWQVHRLARAADPLAECEHVPGSAGFGQVFKAASRVGVPPERIDAVRAAAGEFDCLVRRYAGDRRTFATMASSLADGEHELIDATLRRSCFRENSRIWGIQVKTGLCATFYRLGSSAQVVDSVLLRGMHEIRRLRGGTPVRLSGARFNASHISTVEQSPVKVAKASLGTSPTILDRFSTQPLPKFVSQRKGEYVETYLPPGPIGLVDAPTYYLASAARDVPWRGRQDEKALEMYTRMSVTKPSERVLIDMFVDEEMCDAVDTFAEVYGSLSNLGQTIPMAEMSEAERLPMDPPPLMRGRAVESVHTPHVPRYSEILEDVCSRMGWDAKRFLLFRWEFRYPILGSVLYAQVRLPDYGTPEGLGGTHT